MKEHVGKEIKCLDKGFVRIVDYMGDDSSVVQAARVSYGAGTKTKLEDRDLLRYMLRHSHGTPFEMNAIKFHVKAPIVCFRQWHRHRVGISINELSGRYSEMPEECYLPDITRFCEQSKTNKQGSGDQLDPVISCELQNNMSSEHIESFEYYHKYLDNGVSREISRLNLPLSTYSEMYWLANLRSLFHFLKLRASGHAQWEIRQYANAMYDLIKPIFPESCEAFEDYMLYAHSFSRQEMELLRSLIEKNTDALKESNLSKLEKKEFRKKLDW